MISYIPLNVTLAKKNIKKTKLAEDLKLSSTTLAKFAKNEPIKLEILDRICNYLDCSIEEVVEIIKQKEAEA